MTAVGIANRLIVSGFRLVIAWGFNRIKALRLQELKEALIRRRDDKGQGL